ncbi:MAG: choice-of-anchor tandem repeat GloVer-containing protein [Verrucomicrobiota bacterium]
MKILFLKLLVALALFSSLVWSPGGSASAQTFVNLHSFVFTNGTGPVDTLIISSNTLYGTTRSYGGGIVNDGFGTVFRLNRDGSGFTNVYTFTGGTDGGNLNSSLILSGNTLYGTATFDGGSNDGCVFGISTGGTGLTNIYSFSALDPNSPSYTNSDGAYPQAGLVLSGGTLYGTAYDGGAVGWGTIFAVNTNGGSFTNLHSFAVTDGQYPVAPLIQSGTLLYGTTADGGNAYGTLFAIGTNGQGFTNFYNFTAAPGYPYTNSDGANPLGGLVISGSTLYGTASDGGGAGDGTVFKINTDGTGYLRLHDFSGTNNAGFNTDGAFPQAGLVLSGNELYGTAIAGGSSGNGTVFMLDMGKDFQSYLPYILVVFVALLYGLFRWSRTDSGGNRVDSARIATPIFGNIWVKYQVALFARTLSTLLSGGLPLVPSLETAASSIGSRQLSRAVKQSVGSVREGKGLATSLKNTKIFPELSIEMIEVGEATGALPGMLNSVAEFFEEDVQTALGASMALIEPLILIVMAIFVGGVLISLYLPIFSLGMQGAH